MKTPINFRRLIEVHGLLFVLLLAGREVAAQSSSLLDDSAFATRSARVSEPKMRLVRFEGSVSDVDGSPAAGSVVTSAAGGQALTDSNGRFQFSARVPLAAENVQVTAVSGSRAQVFASQQVSLNGASGAVSVALLQLAQGSTCSPSWLPTFGGEPGVSDGIRSMVVFDDGTGPALYVAGTISTAGGVAANGVVKLQGSTWMPLGTGLQPGDARTLAVFDDGTGAALYVGGSFAQAGSVPAAGIAKWNGSSWTALGSGVDGEVWALAVFDDGAGQELYVGGEFSTAGGVAAQSLAKWDGASWSAFGGVADASGLPGEVGTLLSFDVGGGEALYAGGTFRTAGGVSALNIAKWDGFNWSALGAGIGLAPSSFEADVRSLVGFDDGGGPALYAAGMFNTAGGAPVNTLAKWDGLGWSSITPGPLGFDGVVNTLAVFDGGSGPRLIAAGLFGRINNTPLANIAMWDGLNWSPLGAGTTAGSWALAEFNDGSGDRLFVGGFFGVAGNEGVRGIASWDGSSWSGIGEGLNDDVLALTVIDDGGGEQLYAAGEFRLTATAQPAQVARWNGSVWQPLGGSFARSFTTNPPITSLVGFDPGTGARLVVGGHFEFASGQIARRVAQLNGSTWEPLGIGMDDLVRTLAVFDDGMGERLFAGGNFTNAGGVQASKIAKWDGSSWANLGTGVGGQSPAVFAMTVFNDGGGDALYAAGSFQTAGGTPASNIAKWDGVSWTPLGSGTNDIISALTVFDDGSGERLVAAGRFGFAGGVPAPSVAQWDGTSWSGFGPTSPSEIRALAAFDDGNGEALYAGGEFTQAGSTALNRIAKWDGATWTALGSGTNDSVQTLIVFDDGGGDALYAGGRFSSAPDSGDSFLARWGCAPKFSSDFCNGDGGDQLGCTNCPCANNANQGTIGGCLNSISTSARLRSSGSPALNLPSGDSTDLRFSLAGAPPSFFCILTSGDDLAPTNPANVCFGLGTGTQAILYDGLRCAVTNVRRHGGRVTDTNGRVGVTNSPWGGEGAPTAGIASAGFVAGQTRYFQAVHRDDPAAQCMRGLNTSQAISVTFTAGP